MGCFLFGGGKGVVEIGRNCVDFDAPTVEVFGLGLWALGSSYIRGGATQHREPHARLPVLHKWSR